MMALNKVTLVAQASFGDVNNGKGGPAVAKLIPAEARGVMAVAAFCALAADANIDGAIRDAAHNLAAAQSADAVRQAETFIAFSLPAFDAQAISALLARTPPDLEAAAAAAVQAHLSKLGRGGATWVGDGMQSVASASAGLDHEICPFCTQDLAGSPVLRHYQAYFSAAYDELKRAVAQQIEALNDTHGGLAALTCPATCPRVADPAGITHMFISALTRADRDRTFVMRR